MRLRFKQLSTFRGVFRPGDEIYVQALNPELEGLLLRRGMDDGPVVELVVDEDADELAVMQPSGETATVKRGPRREALSR